VPLLKLMHSLLVAWVTSTSLRFCENRLIDQ
jgi:hypothetical protein